MSLISDINLLNFAGKRQLYKSLGFLIAYFLDLDPEKQSALA